MARQKRTASAVLFWRTAPLRFVGRASFFIRLYLDCFGSPFLAHRLWRITEANDAYETQCESVRAKYMIFVDFCFVISYHCIIKDGARHARFLGIRI